jgi:hypothetical protein
VENKSIEFIKPGSGIVSHQEFIVNIWLLPFPGSFVTASEAGISLVTMAGKSEATRRHSG